MLFRDLQGSSQADEPISSFKGQILSLFVTWQGRAEAKDLYQAWHWGGGWVGNSDCVNDPPL